MSEKIHKKKYRVNLPKTSFAMKASLATREPERLKLWEEEGLERKILDQVGRKEKKFILHDGPPYANGRIHIGHALNKTLKDIIVRYKTHLGYKTTYVPGWDCHGLPIEHALFKELGKRKEHVDQIHFRKEARKYANKYVAIQKEEFKRLGIFGDWDNPYLTMNPEYQSVIAKSFYEIYEKGYVVRRKKPIYWCFDCETALAEAELEYQDKTSQAIFVSFPIHKQNPEQKKLFQDLKIPNGTKAYYLIWTTTPWTLPANVGIALHPDLEYGIYLKEGKEVFIFAKALEERLKEKLAFTDLKCLKTASGGEIKKIFPEYQHPFIQRDGQVILADYVSSTDGTGIVHIAPGHGEEDYVVGHLKNQLPIESPVDHRGTFTEDFGKDLPLKGIHVFKSNNLIVEHLKKTALLQGTEVHQHSYPHCWRCKKPIIFRATLQWFLKIDEQDLRKRVMDVIGDGGKTRWYPDWGKNRILGMMESRPDWCLSRQRLWGVPIPMACCGSCQEIYLTQEMKEKVLSLFQKESADAWFERPAKDFLPKGAKCQNCGSSELELEKDILDVWFDSGVSHQAVLENGPRLGFPCELYLEGSDQHRGWFQTSLITAVALRNASPFRNVLTHGFVVDGQGKKMSKSLGNVVRPQEVMEKFGADVLRLWVSSCDTNVDIRLSPEILDRTAEAYRKIRNTFRYLLGNISDFDHQAHGVKFEEMDSIDRWALSRLKQVAEEILGCYEENKFHRIYHILHDFCITDLSSFYLDALKDRLYTQYPNHALRRSSQTAFFILAKALCQLTAPLLVFTSDEIWRSFSFGDERSVHESMWDHNLWTAYDKNSLLQWEALRIIRQHSDVAIEKLREVKTVGSSLECQIRIQTQNSEAETFLKKNYRELKMGLIVSEVNFGVGGAGKDSVGGSEFDLEWHDPQGTLRLDKVKIWIEKAEGAKCGRCWKYTKQVGKLADPGLCEDCLPVEQQLSKEQPV